MTAIFFKTLPAVDGFKLHTMRGQPAQRCPGLMDQRLLLFGQGPPIIEPQQVIGKFFCRVAAKICPLHPRILWVAQQRQ